MPKSPPPPAEPAPPPPPPTSEVVSPEIANNEKKAKAKAKRQGVSALRIPLNAPGGASALNIPAG